jgi:glycosyltransferase involved in cell wall biosynthesis
VLNLHLSVIVPILNESAFLEGCLDSLFSQKRSPDEVICCIDNRTADNSESICRRYPVRILISPPGMLTVRDTGIRHSMGDIVVLADADCTYPGTYLSDVETIFLNNDYVAACGWNHWPAPHFIRKWHHRRRISGGSAAFRKRTYLQVGGFLTVDESDYGEIADEETALYSRMKKLGKIGWIETGVYHRRIIGHSKRRVR